jgi:DNA-binding GntR family transcriptional regulator
VRGVGYGWYRLRHISVALWFAGLKLIVAAVDAGDTSLAAELLREHILKFQERYFREWNEYERAQKEYRPYENRNEPHRWSRS